MVVLSALVRRASVDALSSNLQLPSLIELAGELRDEYPVSAVEPALVVGDVMLTYDFRRKKSLLFKAVTNSSTTPTRIGSVNTWRPS